MTDLSTLVAQGRRLLATRYGKSQLITYRRADLAALLDAVEDAERLRGDLRALLDDTSQRSAVHLVVAIADLIREEGQTDA